MLQDPGEISFFFFFETDGICLIKLAMGKKICWWNIIIEHASHITLCMYETGWLVYIIRKLNLCLLSACRRLCIVGKRWV